MNTPCPPRRMCLMASPRAGDGHSCPNHNLTDMKSKNRSKRKRQIDTRRLFRWRNARLREMGFMSYAEYIESDRWQARRKSYYADKSRECFVCGAIKELYLHHCTYHNIGEERDRDLVCLCGRCHRLVHSWGESFSRKVVLAMRDAFHRTGRPEVGLKEIELSSLGRSGRNGNKSGPVKVSFVRGRSGDR